MGNMIDGGEIIARMIKQEGIGHIFTLSGGHIFPFYDAAVKQVTPPVRLVDVRHEQTATFAAEATAKLQALRER